MQMVESEMISKVKALGMISTRPVLAIMIPKNIGLRVYEKSPVVTNFDLFTSSIPMRHESAIDD